MGMELGKGRMLLTNKYVLEIRNEIASVGKNTNLRTAFSESFEPPVNFIKMKSLLLLVGYGFVMPIFAQAQSGKNPFPPPADSSYHFKSESRFSLNVHGGYELALGSTFAFYPDDITSIKVQGVDNTVGSKTTKYQAPTKGLGEGFRAGVGISYIVNDFINVGLDFDYFRSTIRKIKDSTSSQTFSTGTQTAATYNERNIISYDALLLTFTPSFTLKAISRPKWFIYNKVGAVIVIRPNSIEHDITDVKASNTWMGYAKDSSSHSDLRYDWGIRNPSLGFMGAMGIQIKLTEKLRVFSEVQFSHIVFSIKSRIVKDYTVDGQNMESTLPMSQREIYFKKDFETTGTGSNPNAPGEAAVQRLPITYVGLQAGLVYRF